VSVPVFLFRGEGGAGPGPHRHPYDEIQFIRIRLDHLEKDRFVPRQPVAEDAILLGTP
jgi:hypothetical protein